MSRPGKTAVIPKAGAFAATALPMRPPPMTPSCLPRSSIPSMKSSPQPFHAPARMSRSPSPTLRATPRISEGDRLIRAGAWKGWGLDFMLGMELRGKQLGVIGGRRIGKAGAAKGPPFGLTALLARRDRTLDELLGTSDVISIHAPGTPATRHPINKRTPASV